MMKEIIEKHFKENIREYILLSIILLLGIIIGVVIINNFNLNQKEQIIEYLKTFIYQIKEKNVIDYSLLLKNSILENIRYMIILMILCFSIWAEIGIIILIGYKGISLGFSISSAITTWGIGKGSLFAICLILLNELIIIPSLFYISIMSIKKYKSLISGDYDNKVLLIRNIFLAFIAVAIMMILASLIQTYLSTNMFLLFKDMF